MANVHALNGKLTAQPYVSGFVPSKDDATTFKEMFGGNTAAIQWAARMASYYQSERATILDPTAKTAEKKEEKKAEAKHVDPAEDIPKDLPVAAAAPLIANFKKFCGDKSAYFMFVSLEFINDLAAFIAGPEGFSAAEILTLLTDCKNCEKLCDTYIKIAKTSEKKQAKVREELTKLVEEFMGPKIGGVKKLDLNVSSKPKAEVDPEIAELIAEFAKFVAGQTQKHTTPKMLTAVLEYLPEGFHKADIKSMLTNGDDCDELLETYVRIAVVPSADKLRARNELVGFVEAFAESKGITHEEMCF